jgi:hypothetical protein
VPEHVGVDREADVRRLARTRHDLADGAGSAGSPTPGPPGSDPPLAPRSATTPASDPAARASAGLGTPRTAA